MTAKLAVSVVFLAVLALSSQASAAAPTIYTVSKVVVTADAGNAVEAKEKALAEAQQIALRQLFKRMTGWSAHSRLPVLADEMVERMVDGFAVRRESNSNTRYIATLDFTFEPNAVRDILNRFAVAYTDQQAPQATLVPVLIEGGAARPGSGNAWYEAFASIDTEHSLTPLKLVPPAANLSAEMVGGLSSSTSSRSLFETLAYQYRAENLVVAIADVDAQATQLRMRLIGRDAVGGFSLDRTFRIHDRDIAYAAELAAQISTKIIEGRWKRTQLASQGALDGPVDLQTVSLTAQFSGLKAWQVMRARLQQVPGVQSVDVKALNARGASITVDFPGGGERLAQAARSQGLALEQRGGGWVLVAR